MKTYTFSTGRTYDTEQCITVTVDKIDVTDFPGLVDLHVTFIDASRHITGKAWIPMLNESFDTAALQRSVMHSYDNGFYTAV